MKYRLLFLLLISVQSIDVNAQSDSLFEYYKTRLDKCLINNYDSVDVYLNALRAYVEDSNNKKLALLLNEYNAVKYSFRYTSKHNNIDSLTKYYLKCIQIGKEHNLSISTIYYDLIYEHVVNCENKKVTQYLAQYEQYLLNKSPQLLNAKYSTIKATYFSYCLNKYDSAIHYYRKSEGYYKENKNPKELGIVLENVALAYLELNNPKMAKAYLNEALAIEQENKFKDGEFFCKYQLARIIYKDEPQLAKTYLNQSKEYFLHSNQFIRAGECAHLLASLHLNQGQIIIAKENIQESIKYLGVQNNSSLHLTAYQTYADILYANKEYNEAIKVTNKALEMNKTFQVLKHEMELHEILYKSYSKLGNKANAFNALLKFNYLKDSLNTIEQEIKIKDIEEKYQSAKKEKALALATQEKRFFKKQRWLFAGIAALIGLLAIIYFRQHNRKKVQELQREMAEVQLASLKSQMNPHFMFNSINSIKGLIINEAAEAAADQLTRFSKLMRSTLNYSSEKNIILAKEIEFLKLYSELERFKGNILIELDFDIQNGIDAENTKIIPFLIQPFIENAFKHAFHSMQGRKPKIDVCFKQENDFLEVYIEDNGSGVKDSKASAHESKGTALVEKRLELHNGTKNNVEINFRGENLGTLVRLRIKKI